MSNKTQVKRIWTTKPEGKRRRLPEKSWDEAIALGKSKITKTET